MSADPTDTAIAADRASRSASIHALPGTAAERGARALAGDPVRVAIVGATGYVGAELIRLLALHPHVRITGLVGRERKGDPIAHIHPHLATRDLRVHDHVPDDAEAVFLALPHGAVAGRIDEFLDRNQTVIDLGPDFRLHDPADYPTWYHFDHPRPDLLATAVYGLPELHRAELVAAGSRPGAIVGSPGCYATTTILALAPLARAGLIGDLVVDAKSGVSGAGSRPEGRPPLRRGQREREGVRHLHAPPHRRDRAGAGGAVPRARREPRRPGRRLPAPPDPDDARASCPPATCARPGRCRRTSSTPCTRPPTATRRSSRVTPSAPATKHVLGSNEFRVWCRLDERTGRVLAIGVLDNLVKGAAGQAIQAFNVVHGLPEPAGLLQLPLAP